ncbi:GNAT family acetyltransferase [Corynebacterium guangdongense]|uniref:GNAT superfamily N-acetyltransferase n=1 Tax=Corynebacterium guangdongense TaxID=1783348 RepID=A0ABU1ZX55_9CORY|nr:GNAT family acetyltransferase [Corynebacterium guangdongense]MDR7329522.1 GNAT superfamily N-acetyltransferase [Corynebacterium guangdongense]WJZ18087.1 hypothetical protein CGUA_07625 [Corynebacterium guangdongense]
MPQIAQFDRPVASEEPSDDLRTFVFMANLAAQEATGDAAASVSLERVFSRLKGSSESDSILLALVDGQLDAPRSALGHPLISSSAPEDASPVHDVLGFTHLSVPLLEERDIIEFELVLDVEYLPMPGEDLGEQARTVIRTLVDAVVDAARTLGRHVLQIWIVHPVGQTPGTGPMARSLAALGFERALTEVQSALPVPDSRPAALPEDLRVEVVSDYAVPPHLIDDVLTLLSDASTDVPHGGLRTERAVWTPQRLSDAAARLHDRDGHHLLVLLVDAEGSALALTEFMTHAGSTPGVVEQGVTFVAARHRGRGFGLAVTRWGLTALRETWPDATRVYTSNATTHEAMLRINDAVGREPVSGSSAWQRVLG